MISKNATLEEIYMHIARENTKYDSFERITLKDYSDDVIAWETDK